MVPYRFDERVSHQLSQLVPRRREMLATYEVDALDDLLATGPAVLVDAPPDVSSLVRHLLTTCSLQLVNGSVVELYGVIDFLAANTPPRDHGVPGALLVGDDVLVDPEGAVDEKHRGAVYVLLRSGALEDELYPLAPSLEALLRTVKLVFEETPERLVPSGAPPRSSFIRELVSPARRVRPVKKAS
jgi:hypothetical protein